MSRQTVRQRLALQSAAQPPVIPAHYRHTEVKPLAVVVVVVLLLVGFLAGAVA